MLIQLSVVVLKHRQTPSKIGYNSNTAMLLCLSLGHALQNHFEPHTPPKPTEVEASVYNGDNVVEVISKILKGFSGF